MVTRNEVRTKDVTIRYGCGSLMMYPYACDINIVSVDWQEKY